MATNGSVVPARITLVLGLIAAGLGILIQFLVGVPGSVPRSRSGRTCAEVAGLSAGVSA